MVLPNDNNIARLPPKGKTVNRVQISDVGVPKRAPMVGRSAKTLADALYSIE
jgi:hypothetical protein